MEQRILVRRVKIGTPSSQAEKGGGAPMAQKHVSFAAAKTAAMPCRNWAVLMMVHASIAVCRVHRASC